MGCLAERKQGTDIRTRLGSWIPFNTRRWAGVHGTTAILSDFAAADGAALGGRFAYAAERVGLVQKPDKTTAFVRFFAHEFCFYP
jgi:hypothetical protein